MDKSTFEKQWKKLLKIESTLPNGKVVTRKRIGEELGISEQLARFYYEALKYREIISEGRLSYEQRIRAQNRDLSRKNQQNEKRINKLTRELSAFSSLTDQRLSPPYWLLPEKAKAKDSIVMAALSDTHFDEVVNPEAINYANAYDREIAVKRLEKWAMSVIRLDRDYFTGMKTKGLVLTLLGDMISGTIHEELEATNETEPTDSVLFWSEQLCAAISLLLEHFKHLFIPCVIGNHGRLKRKVEFKNDVHKSWDYLLYHLIAREFRKYNSKIIRFYIPSSTSAYFPVYDTHYCLNHGHGFRGGSGWAGPLMPVMRGDRKKRDKQSTLKRPYDVLVCGHFHTMKNLGNIIMNGSLIGLNEFADRGEFGYQKPEQALWVNDPEHGPTLFAPVRCKSKEETWEKSVEENKHPF